MFWYASKLIHRFFYKSYGRGPILIDKVGSEKGNMLRESDSYDMSCDINKLVAAFMVGISFTSMLYYKLLNDHFKLLRNLYVFEPISEAEIESITREAMNNSDDDINIDVLQTILVKLYKCQENKLFDKVDRISTIPFIFQLPAYVGLMDQRFIRDIEDRLKLPLHLRRCQNIIRQLNDNGQPLLQMLFPQFQPFSMTKNNVIKLQQIVINSLNHDLFDLIEIQQHERLQEQIKQEYLLQQQFQQQNESIQNESLYRNDSIISTEANDEDHNEQLYSTTSANDYFDSLTPIKKFQKYEKMQHSKKASRTSDVFDYLHMKEDS
jgi:hypothetical protein